MFNGEVTSPLTTPLYSAIYLGSKIHSCRQLFGPDLASSYEVTMLRSYGLASNEVTTSYERA